LNEEPSFRTGSSPGTRPKLPPPVIAPKPAALRRSSLPSPSEPTFPSPLNRSTPNLSRGGESPSPVVDAFQKGNVTSPALEAMDHDQEGDYARPSVKSMASSWGQQPKYGDRSKDAARNEGSAGDSQEVSLDVEREEDAQLKDSPPIVVPSVLNPPTVPMPQPRPRPVISGSERRRSSISNRYSSIILPPLKEVPTPESSLREQTTSTTIPSAKDLQLSMSSAYASVDKENGVDEMLSVEKSAISASHDLPPVNETVFIRK
jgi:hypothetical protein